MFASYLPSAQCADECWRVQLPMCSAASRASSPVTRGSAAVRASTWRASTAAAAPDGYPTGSEDAIVRATAMLAHEVSTMSVSLQVLLTSLMSSRVTW